MEIPSTVASTEEVETSDAAKETPKPKKKRSSKKKSAEQEKADKIIQEAIAKAKSEGREVPKVIQTEDGQEIQVDFLSRIFPSVNTYFTLISSDVAVSLRLPSSKW